ncbi:MAG: amidohydrolase [Hydrogenibacillus sp.]|nr:amidohydrolase [Hydrogenibacillus sp.]
MKLILEDADLWLGTRIARGYVIIEDGRIAAVGEGKPSADVTAAEAPYERRALGGRLVLPGLINTHNHTPMSLLRGLGEGLVLKRWLEEVMWPKEAAYTDEDAYWGTLLAQLEMIETGTTAFAEMYDRIDIIAEAVGQSGLRAVLARGMIGLGDERTRAAKLAEAVRVAKRWHGAFDGRVTTMIAPHSAYTCPEPFLRDVAAAAREVGRPIHTHLAETEAEEAAVQASAGMRSTALLEKVGLFDGPALVAHAVHLTDAEIALLAARNVRISHNPVSNLKLGSGIAPLTKLLAAGLVVGLGTDGPASNNNLDLFEEIRFAALLAKGMTRDASHIPPAVALKMATEDGARALFLEDVGRLTAGMRADLIVVETSGTPFVPRHDVLAHVVYNGRGTDVFATMVDGRWLMWNRTVLTLDAERIRYEAERRAARFRAG